MAVWLKRCALFSVLGFPIAMLATRFDLLNSRVGVLIVAFSFLIGLLVVIASGFLILKRKTPNASSLKALKLAAVMSLIPVIGIGSVLFKAREIPMIHNISTDVNDPPQFSKVVSLRTASDNSLEYDKDQLASLQQSAYPNIKTYYSQLSLVEAKARAIEVVSILGWQLIDNNEETNIIEASDTSALWRFTDDIVIRFRQGDGKTVIDLRSVSRFGQSDLGVNAKRIEKFISTF